MECSDIKNKLIPFINNELNSNEMYNIRVHFKECKSCQSLYTFTKNSLLEIKKEKRIENNSFFYQSVMTKMEGKQKVRKISISQQFLKYGIAAMLSIMSIVGGSYIGSFGAEIINDNALNDNQTQYEIMDIANNDIDLFKDL